MRHKQPKWDVARAFELWQEGRHATEIASALKYSASSIRYYAKIYGWPRTQTDSRRVTRWDVSEARRLWDLGVPQAEIADRVSAGSASTIATYGHRNGWPKHPKSHLPRRSRPASPKLTLSHIVRMRCPECLGEYRADYYARTKDEHKCPRRAAA